MTKLLIVLGIAVALLLMWHELWLHVAIFATCYTSFLRVWHVEQKNQRGIRHINIMLKSLRGIRRAHRRGYGT